MSIAGVMMIAGHETPGEGEEFYGMDAALGTPLAPAFRTASPAQLALALEAAEAAAPQLATSAPAARAAMLDAMAQTIADLGDDLITRAMAETGLPRPRLEGERARTMGQLRMFATLLREGDFARVRIDHADPARNPAPKPDLRLSMQPLGPVAVFGASNFPLAFSVAGGDTASALAAGCPVVVKGHPAHPGTAELVARALAQAIASTGMPAGTFSLLQDNGITVGQALVADARIKAVGFTGSRRAGEALVKIAQDRAEPIPIYAEMSAINPVILCPARLEEAAETIAQAFVGSLTLGVGQFCTNPGLVLAVEGAALDRFGKATADAVAQAPAGTMLTTGIASAFAQGSAALAAHPAVTVLAAASPVAGRANAQVFSVSASSFLADPSLHAEVFGPAALIVRCGEPDEIGQVLRAIEGQLTIALHFTEADHALVAKLLPLAMTRAGRVLANGFGTGVEVSPAMVHGGPYPATSDTRSTSVGTMAIERFLRPVCLQDFPEVLLPEAVKQANPWELPRREW